MLTALAIGWLTVQVSASTATAPAVIIAGADEITRLTATVGGNQTFTGSETDGYSDGDSSSRSRQELHLGFGTRTGGTSTSRNWQVLHGSQELAEVP